MLGRRWRQWRDNKLQTLDIQYRPPHANGLANRWRTHRSEGLKFFARGLSMRYADPIASTENAVLM